MSFLSPWDNLKKERKFYCRLSNFPLNRISIIFQLFNMSLFLLSENFNFAEDQKNCSVLNQFQNSALYLKNVFVWEIVCIRKCLYDILFLFVWESYSDAEGKWEKAVTKCVCDVREKEEKTTRHTFWIARSRRHHPKWISNDKIPFTWVIHWVRIFLQVLYI